MLLAALGHMCLNDLSCRPHASGETHMFALFPVPISQAFAAMPERPKE